MFITADLLEALRQGGGLNFASGTVLGGIFMLTGLVLIPRTFLCIAAGAFFGMASVPIIVPSTTAGGIIAFILARYFLFEKLRLAILKRPRWAAIADAVDSEGWRLVSLLRFGSPVPTAVQNYFFGLTKIGVWPFAFSTFVFSIPQITLYVYLGVAGRAALIDDKTSPLSLSLMGIGTLTLATVVTLIARRCRAALREFESHTAPHLSTNNSPAI